MANDCLRMATNVVVETRKDSLKNVMIAAHRECTYLDKQRVFDTRVHVLAKLFNEPVKYRGMREMVYDMVEQKKQWEVYGASFASPTLATTWNLQGVMLYNQIVIDTAKPS